MSKSTPELPANNQPLIAVWSWPIRVFHFLLIILLPALYWTANEGMMNIHQYLGISVLVLVVWRIIWGFCGSHYARFKHFIVHPRHVFHYAKSVFKRESPVYLSHNPMGGYMVVLLLILLLLQGFLGLFATDDIIFEGPLARFVSYDQSILLTGWHFQVFDIIIVAVGLHILAVFWYQFYKRQRLIPSMIDGKKAHSRYLDKPASQRTAQK